MKTFSFLYSFLLWILLKYISLPCILLVGRRKALQMLSKGGIYHFLLRKRLFLPSNPRAVMCCEREVTNLVKRIHGKLFVDIGANWGYYSALLSPNFDMVFAVECHPQNARKLADNMIGYDNVHCFEYAITDVESLGKLFISGINIGTHSLIIKRNYAPVEVKTTMLPLLLFNRSADLVKVDTEGNEWQILKGAESVMANIKRWVIEVHPMERKSDRLVNLLKSHGYRVKWLDKRHIFAFRREEKDRLKE